jgi:hypothetical protein
MMGRRGRRVTGASGRAKKDTRKSRPGLPDPASVVAVKTFTSPKGRQYRIIETDETDAYDPPLTGVSKGPRKKRR